MTKIENILSKEAISKKLEDWKSSAKEHEQAERDKQNQERTFKEANNLIQLDFWANNQRGVPNSVLRGSLFAAIQGKNPRYCQREVLHESNNIKIVFTGKRLNQSQLDVWECALHIARLQNLGTKIEFTEYGFLKTMDRSTGKANHEWLKNTFAALGACWVEITHDKLTYCGSLIEKCYRDEESGNCVMIMNPELARLYEGNRASWIQWEERQKIGKRKPLAQWLHGYLASHARWYPHKVETIRDYSGSETKEVWKFKQNLNTALEHLQSLELIKSFRIDDNNLVHIEKEVSKAQQKYIDKERTEREVPTQRAKAD